MTVLPHGPAALAARGRHKHPGVAGGAIILFLINPVRLLYGAAALVAKSPKFRIDTHDDFASFTSVAARWLRQ